MAKLNRAAFSREDVDDAKRGHPDFDLRDYAAWNGMEFLDHRTPAGFRAALPCDEQLQSNVLRGTLPGGEYGVLAHEGLEIEWSVNSAISDLDWNGTFYGVRLVHLRGEVKPARVPCTVAGVRVPETAGTHPYLRIDTRRSCPPFSFTNRTKVADLVGEKDWSVWCEPEPEPGTVERLVAEPVAELLRAHTDDGLFQAVVWWGTLVVRGNGFLRAEGVDELGHAASTIARRLREVCGSLAAPRAFDARLPRPLSSEARELPVGFYPAENWRKWAIETAERHGLGLENPVAYHRAFPSVPVPGTAYIVLRGEIPHVGPGRLVIHREGDAFRAAVVVAAPPAAAPTPPGGLAFPEHGARLEVADGLLAVWAIASWSGDAMLATMDDFCATADGVISEWRRGRLPG